MARTLGDAIRNAVRKAERRISYYKEIAKDKNTSESQRSAIASYIKELRQAKNQSRTYTSTGKRIKSHTTEVREEALKKLNALNAQQGLSRKEKEWTKRNLSEKLEKLTKSVDKYQYAKANRQFQDQINLASKKGTAGIISPEQMHVFFKATLSAWKGLSNQGERFEAIKSYYGKENLWDVFDMIMNKEQKTLELMRVLKEQDGQLTEEQMEFYADVLDDDGGDKYAPGILALISSISQ